MKSLFAAGKNMTEGDKISALLKDRDAFNKFIYTPLDEAVLELERRSNDPSILTPEYVPHVLRKGPRAALFRQVFTPNYEARRFLSIIESTPLKPLVWEYSQDKFTSNNELKHALGKLHFYSGTGKKGGAKIETLNIIDFNTWNGKTIADVRTLWGQSLIEFHHKFIDQCFKKIPLEFFDASDWFKANGGGADNYYAKFLSLFVKNGILFENFMLDTSEGEFTKEVFLPSFMKVLRETGLRPLIVSLEPTDIEGSKFWICYPETDMSLVKKRLAVLQRRVKSPILSRILSIWT